MWVLDAWVPTKLKSVEECMKGQMRENLRGFGCRTRPTSHYGMPFPTDEGSVGEML